MEQGRLEQGHDSRDMSKKGKDVSPKRDMFIKLGGLAPPEWFSLSLSLLAFSLEHVLGFPSMYPLYYFSCFLPRSCSLGMAMSVLHFLYLAGLYP